MTAEELFLKYFSGMHYDDVTPEKIEQYAIDFAKLKVRVALESAAEKATMNLYYPSPYEDSNEKGLTHAYAEYIIRGGEDGKVEIDIDSILNSYNLEDIK